jgi:hypothetical protein
MQHICQASGFGLGERDEFGQVPAHFVLFAGQGEEHGEDADFLGL